MKSHLHLQVLFLTFSLFTREAVTFQTTVRALSGKSATLPCGSDGQTHNPNITWSFNNNVTILTWTPASGVVYVATAGSSKYEFRESDKSLVVKSTGSSDYGLYTCVDNPQTVQSNVTLEYWDGSGCPYWSPIVNLSCQAIGHAFLQALASMCIWCSYNKRKKRVYDLPGERGDGDPERACLESGVTRNCKCCSCCCFCVDYFESLKEWSAYHAWSFLFQYSLVLSTYICFGIATTRYDCDFSMTDFGQAALGLTICAAIVYVIANMTVFFYIDRSQQTSSEKQAAYCYFILFLLFLPIMALVDVIIFYCVDKNSSKLMLKVVMGQSRMVSAATFTTQMA